MRGCGPARPRACARPDNDLRGDPDRRRIGAADLVAAGVLGPVQPFIGEREQGRIVERLARLGGRDAAADRHPQAAGERLGLDGGTQLLGERVDVRLLGARINQLESLIPACPLRF